MNLDGRTLALHAEQSLASQVQSLSLKPKLTIILVGDNVASATYVRMKKAVAERIGISVEVIERSKATVEELKTLVSKACSEQNDGVMVQLPVPDLTKTEVDEALAIIPSSKDVDGLNNENLAKIMDGKHTFLPATVRSIESLLQAANVTTESSIAVVGSNGMVGRPLSDRLKFLGYRIAKFDLGDSLARILKYDVVVSCTGKKNLIDGDMVKDGVVAIDVGFPYGDFDYDTVAPKAKYITPVPGGVGPMTVVSLMENVVEASQKTG